MADKCTVIHNVHFVSFVTIVVLLLATLYLGPASDACDVIHQNAQKPKLIQVHTYMYVL